MASLRKTEIKATVTYIDSFENRRSNWRDRINKIPFDVTIIYEIDMQYILCDIYI